MRYFSAFTGVGSIEKAVIELFPNSICVGYSEFDKHAEYSYLKNFPEMLSLNFGDLQKHTRNEKGELDFELIDKNIPDMDFFFGGPPCQDLSVAKTGREGLAGEKSGLFYDFLAIILVKRPKYFLMENVASMTKLNRRLISIFLGVNAHLICSDHFTAQKRNRLYWYNWPNVSIAGEGWRWFNLIAWSSSRDYDKDGNFLGFRERETKDGRANTCTTGKGCGSQSSMNYIEYDDGSKRILTPGECEQLQGLPRGWTIGSDSQRYKQIGNAITYDVALEILKGI